MERFAGIVLTGGASSRMGADKALLEVAGRPLAAYALEALLEAGASQVVAVGGALEDLGDLGFESVADRFPGEGPLGGVVSGLGTCTSPIAVVLACDQPAVDAPLVIALVRALCTSPEASVAVAMAGGVRQVLTGAYRRSTLGVLSDAFTRGERSLRAVLSDLAVVDVEVDRRLVIDLDVPEDARRYAAQRQPDPADPPRR